MIPKIHEKKTKRTKNEGRTIIFRVSDFLLPIGGSSFSGQVSAIEARDEAIFTRNIED